MIDIFILEDEEAALNRLIKIIKQTIPDARVVGSEDSVESCVEWLECHAQPDLIFMDIHLADGSSFEIFQKVTVQAPVIFTTAYDKYAIKAFKVNSIDYLLKPIKPEELLESFEKFRLWNKNKTAQAIDYDRLCKVLKESEASYQERIVVKYGQKIKTIEIANTAYFYTAEKVVFLCTFDANNYPIDYNLDALEGMVNPKEFFRINRQFIINIKAIDQMFSYSKSRVKILLKPPASIETIVSTDRSGKFKSWLSGKTT